MQIELDITPILNCEWMDMEILKAQDKSRKAQGAAHSRWEKTRKRRQDADAHANASFGEMRPHIHTECSSPSPSPSESPVSSRKGGKAEGTAAPGDDEYQTTVNLGGRA